MAGRTAEGRRDLLREMTARIIHRGPDDEGLWWSDDDLVGLGHRRLAIIDLSPAGHQPMLDSSRQLAIIFNGEIYNFLDLRLELEKRGHEFHTASDTEVILEAYHEWGMECLEHLDGMFALALYDKTRRRLLLARDRAGEKPFFFTHANGRFAFASELKALFADSTIERRIDPGALESFLAYGYVAGRQSIIRGIQRLLPGERAIYHLDHDTLSIDRYWSLPEPAIAGTDPVELTERLHTLLRDSVRRQLMAADVPVGILLSGGVDSSLVVAVAAEAVSKPLRTFTISFPGHGRFDEGPYARLIAEHFGTEHTELAAEPMTVELLPQLARQYDEPIADSSMVPTYLVSRLIRPHATVALGGDGGDELFAGYPHYNWLLKEAQIRRVIPPPLRRVIAGVARQLPVGLRGRNYAAGLDGDGIAQVNLYFSPEWRKRLLRAHFDESQLDAAPEKYRISMSQFGKTITQHATAADFRTYLADDILTKVDRASMLTSLEVRAPWLDRRIIEFAFSSVPDNLKIRGNERKVLPRLLAERLLPKTFDSKRKQGFSIPLDSWLRGEWGQSMEATLMQSQIFDHEVIKSLFEGQRRGRSNSQRLFALAIFELWTCEYGASL
jgi:asparagine synthase (glutamine-hydrolysing)